MGLEGSLGMLTTERRGRCPPAGRSPGPGPVCGSAWRVQRPSRHPRRVGVPEPISPPLSEPVSCGNTCKETLLTQRQCPCGPAPPPPAALQGRGTPGASSHELSAQLSLGRGARPGPWPPRLGLSGLPQNSSHDGEKRAPRLGRQRESRAFGQDLEKNPRATVRTRSLHSPHTARSPEAGGRQRIPRGGEAWSLQGPRGRSGSHWLRGVTSHSSRRTAASGISRGAGLGRRGGRTTRTAPEGDARGRAKALGSVRVTAIQGPRQPGGGPPAVRERSRSWSFGGRRHPPPLPPSAGLGSPAGQGAQRPPSPCLLFGAARPCLPRGPRRRGRSVDAEPGPSPVRPSPGRTQEPGPSAHLDFRPSVRARGAPPRPRRRARTGWGGGSTAVPGGAHSPPAARPALGRTQGLTRTWRAGSARLTSPGPCA